MSEIKRIMDMLGRTEIDGEVRGTHLGKVLIYLKTVKDECWDITVSKLALVLGVNPRYIRENYLKGLMYFDIIKLYRNGNTLHWKWIGVDALEGAIIPTEPEEIMMEIKEDSIEPEKVIKEIRKETKKGCCPSCGKKLKKGKKFCSEECLRKYLGDKKK